MRARERGAKIIHVDPRFGRTSASADMHVPIRSGTDIAFLGGIIRHVLETESYFKDYVLHYTNASTIISKEFADTEDLGGVFSGFDPETGTYDRSTWMYEGGEVASAAGTREHATQAFNENTGVGLLEGPIKRDETLQHERCVFQLLRKHYARYTPEMVAQICGIPEAQFYEVAQTLIENSGRERTTALCYAVGWTQQSLGVQIIRAGAILQLLLGNIGRPGGGIMAMRGHATIQGSSDIPTLYDLLPGYLPMPRAREEQLSLETYVDSGTAEQGLVVQLRQVHRLDAEGLVRRRSDRGQRLRLPPPAEDHRQPRALPDDDARRRRRPRRPFRDGPEPSDRLAERWAHAPRAAQHEVAGDPRPQPD